MQLAIIHESGGKPALRLFDPSDEHDSGPAGAKKPGPDMDLISQVIHVIGKKKAGELLAAYGISGRKKLTRTALPKFKAALVSALARKVSDHRVIAKLMSVTDPAELAPLIDFWKQTAVMPAAQPAGGAQGGRLDVPDDPAIVGGNDEGAAKRAIEAIIKIIKSSGRTDLPEISQLLLSVPRDQRDDAMKDAIFAAKHHPDPYQPDPDRVISYIPDVEERIEHIKWTDQKGNNHPYSLRVLIYAASKAGRDDTMDFAREVANGEHYEYIKKALAIINPEYARYGAVLDTPEFMVLMRRGRININKFNSRNHIPGYIDDKSVANQGKDLERGSGELRFDIPSVKGN